jgi:RNA polymerase sigma factor (sigma-70 family)
MSRTTSDAGGQPYVAVQLDVGALYTEHKHKLFGGALCVLRPEGLVSEAGDAVQTVVTHLQRMHAKGTLTARDDWAGYLWKSARNEALRIVRQRDKTDSLEQRIEHNGTERIDPTQGLDPTAEQAEDQDTAARLGAALDQLDSRSRRIFFGYYIENMTDAQLGEEHNLSAQRVGVIRRDAQAKIAQLLDGGEHP